PICIAAERARVHADALHGGIGHPDIGQDVVAALPEIDVAVSVALPVARGLTGNDGREQVGGDAVAGCGGVDGVLRVGERPARNRAHVGEGTAHTVTTDADAAVLLVAGGQVLAVPRH